MLAMRLGNLLKEQEEQIKNRDESLEKAREEIKWLRGMLKEREAVEPILEQDSMVCGICGHEVIWQKMLGDGIWADEELNYCPHCGRGVKWE